jgi:hypothetical protein
LSGYFISQPKRKTFILHFFQNKISDLWLLFVQNQLGNFMKAMQPAERPSTAAFEVANELATIATI